MKSKNKMWKKMAIFGGLATMFVTPIAAIACGENDEEITQAKVDSEQKLINNLGGTKKIETESAIEAVSNATFTQETAMKYGISKFSPKIQFTYLYSITKLENDGMFDLTISVKTEKFTSTGATPHKISAIGIDLGLTKKALQALQESSKSELSFKALSYNNVTLDDMVINELGITISKIGDGVTIKVSKVVDSKQVTFNLAKEGQISQVVEVTFSLFQSVVSQADVDKEQQYVNTLEGPKLWNFFDETVTEKIDAEFDNNLASVMGLNFVRKPGFTYTYSHSALIDDGELSVTITVRSGDLQGTNPMPIQLNVYGLGISKIKASFQAINTSLKPPSQFKAISIHNAALSEVITTYLGFAMPISIPSEFSIKVSKVFGSTELVYAISKRDGIAHTFVVNFTNFLQGVDFTQTSVDVEQYRLSQLTGAKSYVTNVDVEAVTDGIFNQAAAARFGLNGFRPTEYFVYKYSHGAMRADGVMKLTLRAHGGNLTSERDPAEYDITVAGIDLPKVRHAIETRQTLKITENEFYIQSFAANTILDQEKATALGINFPTIPRGIILKFEKEANTKVIKFNIAKGVATTPIPFEVTYDSFREIRIEDVNAEQSLINQLSGEIEITVDKPLNHSDLNFLTPKVVNDLGITGFVPKLDYDYLYSFAKDEKVGEDDLIESDTDTAKLAIFVVAKTGLHYRAIGESAIFMTNVTVKVNGLNMFKTRQTLKQIVVSDQLGQDAFKAIKTNGKVAFDSTIASTLGIAMPTIEAGVEVKITKNENETKVNFELTKNERVETFDVNFIAFTPDITLKDVQDEQAIINSLIGSNKLWTYLLELEAADQKTFDSKQAKRFGFTNFVPKPGYQYKYSHEKKTESGMIALRIVVSVKNLTPADSLVQAHDIEVRFTVRNEINAVIRKINRTTLTYDDFFYRPLGALYWDDRFNLLDLDKEAIGISYVEFPEDIEIKVLKSYRWDAMSFFVRRPGETEYLEVTQSDGQKITQFANVETTSR